MNITARTGRSLGICPGISVCVNGEEVADRCFEYDVSAGRVGLYLHRGGGPYYDETIGGAAYEIRYGKVETSWPLLRVIALNLYNYWVRSLSARTWRIRKALRVW